MGLRDILRAIREHPTVRAELDTARSELRQVRQTLEQSEQDHGSLRLSLEEQKSHMKLLSSKTEALREALMEFCPRLSTLAEMKRFYDTISPSMDSQGFTLYRMAKELTGIDVPSCFPYEDNRGLFEEMDGHQLLDWLTAAHFQAVDWDIIPGSTYESAALREVDTSTPAYRAFEKQLYAKVLERMGFQDLLRSHQEATERISSYSPYQPKRGNARLNITEINKDTFWALIAQAKEHCGQDQEAFYKWLEGRLVELGPEQALNFDNIVHGYRDLAYKYGLWSAASILCDACTDDSFSDFRGWLISQGREVYMAALKDPDSLADVTVYRGCRFESLRYVGGCAYEKLTGYDIIARIDRDVYQALLEELKKDIVYGDGIDFPYTWSETAVYLPKLCANCMTPEELAWRIKYHDDAWNIASPEIQAARATAHKSKRIKKDRGDSR